MMCGDVTPGIELRSFPPLAAVLDPGLLPCSCMRGITMDKKLSESKTFRFHVISLVLALILVGLGAIEESPTLPADWLPYVLIIQNVVGIFLRWVTTEPVKLG